MIFKNFAENSYDQNWGWFALVFLAIFVALFVGFLNTMFDADRLSGKEIFIRIGAIVLAAAGAIAVANSLANASYAIDHLNAKIAEDNLKKKYDIVGVLWNEKRTHPQSYEDLEDISIQDKNSNILSFRYRVDRGTHEPFLLNDSENTQVKANDLILPKDSK